ncbi:NEDD8-activating enzyme E1 regulatory subunit [Aulographum hederae CBS 113979]|uniref:NEDD8-activating enzyme E1 regulatory subunit n=1 Tax=Aulographum hederae CBS 113979 TaxID=1176131 RepID=A0A6G1GWB5_9PEZI|nr:NEDD8-activating enzyme E1 regulatory subunit [Aulographum hederae CBS 113979]
MATTPPPLQGPTSKEKKYDRQLRLWGANGQAALEEAHILLINSGSGVVGIETLKNLVLPGAGNFTILDSAIVEEADLGVNFFLASDSLGKSRAEQCCELLKELNPDVDGHFSSEPIETFITKPDALDPYTLILATAPISPEILEIIIAHATETLTPLFYIHSVGFYSHFSVHLPHAFPVVDTHPDPVTISDLRLLNPWPALTQLVQEKTAHLEAMSDDDHGHVPYVLLLLHFLEKWKSAHDDKAPQNYKEKSEFREMVRAGTRTSNPEGGEENSEEAVAAVLKNLNPPELSSNVKEVFNSAECVGASPDSQNFWIIASAISSFHKNNKVLPLPGSVPDMKAKSNDYIALQNVYKTKAREDFAEVLSIVRDIEAALERTNPIDEKEVEAFCKGAAHIKLVRGKGMHIAKPGETIEWLDRAKFAFGSLTNPDSLIHIYIAFLAYDSFGAAHPADGLNGAALAPGTTDFEADTEKMVGMAQQIIDDIIKEAGKTMEDPEYTEVKEQSQKVVTELVRAGGGELHNISAFTGGTVAQEVIKVITKQYVPVDNCCMWDGVSSTISVLRL